MGFRLLVTTGLATLYLAGLRWWPGVLLGESEKLKQVRYLEIRSVEDLYSEGTLRILHEAILLDEMMAKVKPKFRRENRRPF